jgi:hypothetical protein
MASPHLRLSRRNALRATGALALAAQLGSLAYAQGPAKRPKVAVLYTAFFYRSHAHVILENFLEKYLFNGKRTDPGVDVVSLWRDQSPKGDMTDQVVKDYKLPLYKTIEEAICLGGKKLAVDGIVSIGEHGDYPTNELGQVEYPRKRMFDEYMKVIRRDGRGVPIFNDKHLSYRWEWCKEMVDTAKELGCPFLAGSSVPLAQRIPMWEPPSDMKIEEICAIHGGGYDSYDFHGLEILQSIAEFRKGGETGVVSVECLTGDPMWAAAKAGKWSIPLAEEAMRAELGDNFKSLAEMEKESGQKTHAILIQYKDGTRGTMLKVGGSGIRWNLSVKLAGKEKAEAFRFHVGPWQNRNLFKALSHSIQTCIIERKAPYPVERTLLTSGITALAMKSKKLGKAIATPELGFAYAAADFKAMREMGETWKIITEETKEAPGISPDGLTALDPQ